MTDAFSLGVRELLVQLYEEEFERFLDDQIGFPLVRDRSSKPVRAEDLVAVRDQLRALAARSRGGESFAHGVDELLGAAWDDALEPFRRAGDGAPVTWLHRVG